MVTPSSTLCQPLSDDALKALATVDRRAACHQLFAKYRERLGWHALSILRDPEEAHDVVQEVFIKAMREARLFDADFHIQAWLYRVTRNLCFNLSRDRRRRGGILAAHPSDDARPEDQDDRVFGEERQEEILRAIDQLTAEHRAILMLRYYEDLSYAEIAARLHLKMGTVMSRLSRARGRLHDVLGTETPLLAAG